MEYEELMRLQQDALRNPSLRDELLQTRTADDPMKAFCILCDRLGYRITIYGLATMGREFCDEMLRSVNGGGREEPDGWDDYYEMFFEVLEKKMFNFSKYVVYI